MESLTYRTKRACVIGGVYRRAGETFASSAMNPVPPHLELVGEQGAAAEPVTVKTKLTKKQTVKESEQVTAADLGIVSSETPSDV